MKSAPKKSSRTSSSGKKQSRRAIQTRDRQRARTIQVIAALSVLAGVIVLVGFLLRSDRPGSSASVEGVQSFPNQERGHTTSPVTYPQNPPVGGQHYSAWQNCGVYTQPIEDEYAVHSLEHGAIWITYQPDLPAAELQKLQALTRQSGYRLLSPYQGLPSPIVVSAWGFQLQLDQVDDQRLADFIQKYEQNPLGPEPGAPCTGGVGQPS